MGYTEDSNSTGYGFVYSMSFNMFLKNNSNGEYNSLSLSIDIGTLNIHYIKKLCVRECPPFLTKSEACEDADEYVEQQKPDVHVPLCVRE